MPTTWQYFAMNDFKNDCTDAEQVKTQNPGSMKACANSPSGKHPEALRTQAGHLREVRKVQGRPDDLKRPARRVPTDTTRQRPDGRCCWRSVAAATSVAGR